MAEYMNPFAGSIAPESIPNNPFWSGVNTAQNQATMAPFLNMEMQRQQQGLQRTGMENQEFASPEAVEARKTSRTSLTSKNKLESAEADQKLSNMPLQQQIHVKELKQHLQKLEGTPAAEMFNTLTEGVPALEKAPPAMKAATYAGLIKQFQATHPGQPIPPEYQNYSPEVEKQLSAARLARIMTPAHAQKIAEEKVKGEYALKGHEVSAGATVQAAREHVKGTLTAKQMEIDYAAKQNPGQYRVAQRKVLSNPNSTPEQREMAEEGLSTSLSDDMPKIYQGDPLLQSLTIAALSDPQAAEKIDARKSKLFEDHMVNNGIRVRMNDPQGKPHTVLKSKHDEALKAGWKDR